MNKKWIFRKVLFYDSGSITFEGQVPIWRWSGATQIGQKCSRRTRKKRSREKSRNRRKTIKNYKARTPNPCGIYHTDLSFSFFQSEKKVEKREAKSEVFSGLGPTFGIQKGDQNEDFFGKRNFSKSGVLLKREHDF